MRNNSDAIALRQELLCPKNNIFEFNCATIICVWFLRDERVRT